MSQLSIVYSLKEEYTELGNFFRRGVLERNNLIGIHCDIFVYKHLRGDTLALVEGNSISIQKVLLYAAKCWIT